MHLRTQDLSAKALKPSFAALAGVFLLLGGGELRAHGQDVLALHYIMIVIVILVIYTHTHIYNIYVCVYIIYVDMDIRDSHF